MMRAVTLIAGAGAARMLSELSWMPLAAREEIKRRRSMPAPKGKKPQVFRERDISRAIAGHLKAGLSVHHTEIDKDGRIVIFAGQPEQTSVVPKNEWDTVK